MRAWLPAAFVAAALLGCRVPREPSTATASSKVKVRDIALGRAIGPDKQVTAPAGEFAPGDTIYTSVVTEGDATRAVLSARWSHEGALLQETMQKIAPQGRTVSEFHVFNPSGWTPGDYRVEILLDGRVVGDRAFRVAPSS